MTSEITDSHQQQVLLGDIFLSDIKYNNKKSRYIFRVENLGHPISNLFGLHTVHNRIEQRGDKQVKVGQKNVNVGWNVESKPVCKEGEESQEIKLKEDTNMGDAGVKSFESRFLLGQVEDNYKYPDVGECDEGDVKSEDTESHEQTIGLVDSNIFCRQLHDGHVLTV